MTQHITDIRRAAVPAPAAAARVRPPRPLVTVAHTPVLDGGGGKDRQFVAALARGLDVLRAFRAGDELLGNHEIAARAGLPGRPWCGWRIPSPGWAT